MQHNLVQIMACNQPVGPVNNRVHSIKIMAYSTVSMIKWCIFSANYTMHSAVRIMALIQSRLWRIFSPYYGYIKSVVWRIFIPDYCVFSVRILAYIQSGLWLLISPDFGVYSVRIMAYIQSGLLRIFSPDYGVYSVRIMANILSGLWCIFSPDYGVFSVRIMVYHCIFNPDCGVYSVRIMAYIQSGLCSCLVSAVYHSTKNFFYDIMESDQHYYKTS